MSEFIAFLMNHWELSSLFLALLVILVVTELRKSAGIKEISPQAAVDLYNHQQAVILDTRSIEAYQQGHLVGAIHVDALGAKQTKKCQKKTVILVAENVKQGNAAMKSLQAQGIDDMVMIQGGVSGWVSAGLPLTKK